MYKSVLDCSLYIERLYSHTQGITTTMDDITPNQDWILNEWKYGLLMLVLCITSFNIGLLIGSVLGYVI
jgi:hypothetical protein